MSQINRTIVISGQDGGFSRTIDNLGQHLARAFENANQEIERLSDNSSDFSQVIENRMRALDMSVAEVFGGMVQRSEQYNSSVQGRISFLTKELSVAERQLRIDTERARLAEKQRYRNAITDARENNADPQAIRDIVSQHRDNIYNIDEQNRTQNLQLRGVRELAAEFIENLREEQRNQPQPTAPSNENSEPNKARQAATQAGSAFGNVGRSILNGFGVLGLLSVSGFIGKMIQEGIQLDEAQSSTRGLGMRNVGSGTQYGKKQADMLQYGRNVAMAAGDAGYGVVGNLAFEKRFSQDEGSLLGLTRALRTEQENRPTQRVALEMLNFFRRSDLFNVKRGDFTQLAEKIQFSTQMLEQQGNQMFKTNATTNAQIISAFGVAGVKDQRLMNFTDPINQAIQNPNNDFTKAFMMRSLRKQNPNMSLVELLQQQEQGIYGAGNLSSIMSDLRGQFSGEQLTMSIAKAFGLKLFQAKQLENLPQNMLEKIGSKEEVENTIRLNTGKGGAGVVNRRMAQLDDWFADKGVVAVHKVDNYIGEYEKGGFGGLMKAMSNDVVEAIKSGFQTVTGSIKDWLNDKTDAKIDRGTFFGGGFKTMLFGETEQEKDAKMRAKLNFDYSKAGEPPQLNMYSGRNSLILKGEEFAGAYAGRELAIEKMKMGEAFQIPAGELVRIFAYAMENNLQTMTREQAKYIIEQGFLPQTQVLKELHLNNTQGQQNKVYSTEK